MCWSFEVSLAFGVAELVLCLVQYLRGQPGRSVVPLALTITLMELLEAVMWLHVPASSADTCPRTNQISLILGGILLWAQPLCSAFWGYSTSTKNKGIFWCLLVLSLLQFVAALGHVPFALLHSEGFSKEGYQSTQHNIGESTCATVGPGGHLLWKFASRIELLTLLPNQFSYFLLFFVPLVMWYRPFSLGGVLGVLMFGLLAVTGLYLQTMEAISVFCWQGIVLHLWVLMHPFLFSNGKDLKKQQ